MTTFANVDHDEFEYYEKRVAKGSDTIFVGKAIVRTSAFLEHPYTMRNINKIVMGSEDVHIVRVRGEFQLKTSEKGHDQVRAIVYNGNGTRHGLIIQRFRGKNGKPTSGHSISFTPEEFEELLEFVDKIKFIDFSNQANHRLSMSTLGRHVLVSQEEKNLIDALNNVTGENRTKLLVKLRNESFSAEDLNILSGRRRGLEIFRRQLFENKNWTEPEWQEFLYKNDWIFGYGLDYQFLSILQREPHVSDSELDGSDTVKADFLAGATNFTVIVELKEPNTALFRKEEKIRSKTWGLSTDLMDAVSQILTQKTVWLEKSRSEQFNRDGEQITQMTVDPKCILLIGMKSSLQGSALIMKIKLNTFELFRRDSRNIEIITYDELYDRAFYIVNQRLPNQDEIL